VEPQVTVTGLREEFQQALPGDSHLAMSEALRLACEVAQALD
jgi:hypothetical protein